MKQITKAAILKINSFSTAYPYLPFEKACLINVLHAVQTI